MPCPVVNSKPLAMKKLLYSILYATILLLLACEDCEVISSETEPAVPLVDCPGLGLNIGDACDDDNPDTTNDQVDQNCNCTGTIAVDCPALGLNIGDACDDGNPNTSNDSVDANCICVGQPINSCTGALLVMRAAVENNTLGNLFLDRSDLAPFDFLTFVQLTPISSSAIPQGEAFPFPFSTINPLQDQYFYGFQFGQSGISNPLLVTSTDGSFSPSFLLTDLSYAAPVYHQGELYAIDVTYDEPSVQYAILRIDQSTGQPASIFSGSTTVNSQVVNPVFYSASNGTNKVMFLAGTSLFEYDTDLNAVTHVILEPEINPDMPVTYTGLEYRASTNELLALRHQQVGANLETTLVSISQTGTFMQTALTEIEGYTFFSDGFPLHATAYAQCDEHYYITTPVALEQDVFESYLLEVDMPDLTIRDARFDDFLFGVEIQED